MKRIWLVILGFWLCGIAFAKDQPQGTGELSGRFTINSSGDQVIFSQGNLRKNQTSGVWSFAPHQYDVLGAANVNGSTLAEVVDLFGWSGETNHNFGVSTSPGSSMYSGNFVDWGENPISNGGNTSGTWRTLTAEEWNYFCNNHDKKDITVNDVSGMAYLADNSTMTVSELANSYTAEAWAAVEAKGVLFLPDAGYRSGTTYTATTTGYYWSATKNGTSQAKGTDTKTGTQNNNSRSRGQSVRLVKDAQNCQVTIKINKNIEAAGTIVFK